MKRIIPHPVSPSIRFADPCHSETSLSRLTHPAVAEISGKQRRRCVPRCVFQPNSASAVQSMLGKGGSKSRARRERLNASAVKHSQAVKHRGLAAVRRLNSAQAE